MAVFQEDIIMGKVYKGDSPIPSGHNRPDITLIDLMRGSLPHQAMFIKKDLLVKHPYDENYKIETGNLVGYISTKNVRVTISSRFGDDFLKFLSSLFLLF